MSPVPKMKKPYQVFRDLETIVDVAGSRGAKKLSRFLRKIHFDVNQAALHGRTPLTYACLRKDLDLVNVLLEVGADVNVADRFARTPMHEAALVGSVKLAKIFLDHGAAVDVLDHFANTPLSIALLERNDRKMVEFLVQNGADVNFDRGTLSLHLFLEACIGCHTEYQLSTIEFLLDNGAYPNTECNNTARNALHFVAIGGYVPLAKLLVQRGTLVNITDIYKQTPAMIARIHGNKAMAEYLEQIVAERERRRRERRR